MLDTVLYLVSAQNTCYSIKTGTDTMHIKNDGSSVGYNTAG